MALSETDLYPAIKAFLENQGYTVKGEIGRCDVVAVRAGEGPVIVEMKTRFSLELVFQAVERLAVGDKVYVAIEHGRRSLWTRRSKDILRLCRSLGIGLLTVHAERGLVEPRLDPGPYQRRPNKKRREMLLREFSRRSGDPTAGGTGGRPVMTAYRQDALRLVRELGASGPLAPRQLRGATGVDRAGAILLGDVYGWFTRVDRGIYDLSPAGHRALEQYREALTSL